MTQTDPEVVRRLTTVEQEMEDAVKPEVVVDLISPHLWIPALRAYWPASVVDYVRPECTDITGHGNHLQSAAALGDVTFGRDLASPLLAPIASFGGAANQYLLKADAGAGDWADILGTEVQLVGAQRGLTLGGWFWWSALPGAQQYLMAKDDGAANRQYRLEIGGFTVNRIDFTVWAGAINVTSSANIVVGWNHCTGIYDQPSQTIFVELNGVITSGAVGAAPAALADTGAPFTIGADGAGAVRFTGRGSNCFLSAASVTTAKLSEVRESTKAGYGVD